MWGHDYSCPHFSADPKQRVKGYRVLASIAMRVARQKKRLQFVNPEMCVNEYCRQKPMDLHDSK